MPDGPSRPKVAVRGVAERTREITESLRSLNDGANRSPSLRPEWSRLTLACHLHLGRGGPKQRSRARQVPPGPVVGETLAPRSSHG